MPGTHAENPAFLGRGFGSDLDVDRVITKVVAGTRNYLRSCPPMRDHRITSEAAGADGAQCEPSRAGRPVQRRHRLRSRGREIGGGWRPIAQETWRRLPPLPLSLTAMGEHRTFGSAPDTSGLHHIRPELRRSASGHRSKRHDRAFASWPGTEDNVRHWIFDATLRTGRCRPRSIAAFPGVLFSSTQWLPRSR